MKHLFYASIIFLLVGILTMLGCSQSHGTTEVEHSTGKIDPSMADSKEKESTSKPRFGTITPKELYQLQKEDKKPIIIDVRTAEEFRTIRVPDAILVPLDELDVEKASHEYKLKDKTFYLICRSGRRSATAADKFIDAGIGKPINVTGGTLQWDEEGYPVLKEHK